MRIHEQNKVMKRTLAQLRTHMTMQVSYFQSSKFDRPDDYVWTHEVLNRLAVLREFITSVEDLGIDLED